MKTILMLAVFFLSPGSLLAAEKTVTVTEVTLLESEPGIDDYASRLLLSPEFLRLDDGDDKGDYILFNRKTHVIHSFNHADRTNLLIKPGNGQAIDFKMSWKVDKQPMPGAPSIGGVAPLQYQFYADGHLCKQSVNVKGLLPQVTQALIDYQQTLAMQNAKTLDRVPASLRSSCYMANNYLHTNDYLKNGFPLFEKDDLGRQKSLQDFQQRQAPASLFEPIQGYRQYSVDAVDSKPAKP